MRRRGSQPQIRSGGCDVSNIAEVVRRSQRCWNALAHDSLSTLLATGGPPHLCQWAVTRGGNRPGGSAGVGDAVAQPRRRRRPDSLRVAATRSPLAPTRRRPTGVWAVVNWPRLAPATVTVLLAASVIVSTPSTSSRSPAMSGSKVTARFLATRSRTAGLRPAFGCTTRRAFADGRDTGSN